MPMHSFFPSRAARPALSFVVSDFPYPLALTYARLHEEMDRQEPIAAAWQLRDAFECLLKFSACIAVADCLHSRATRDVASTLASLLLKPQGLSIGDWHRLLEEGLKPLSDLARAGRLAESGRCVPELFALFFEDRGRLRASPLNRKIDGDAESFVSWRNRVFGHGVFKQERQWYANETLRWLPSLHEFYTALQPVMAGWVLVGVTPSGEEVVWQGAADVPLVPRHAHQPWGKPLAMLLRESAVGQPRRLSLGPLLSVQECAICHQPAAFFFDRNRYQRNQDRHQTFFLEYFGGHDREQRDWEETRRLAAFLPPAFEWERVSYDSEEVVEGVRLVFRDFESEYLRPDYLLDALWQLVDREPKGYVYLRGPEGVGKTYLVRGLEREGKAQGVPVLTYHILPGALSDYQTFISELSMRARETLRFRTQEVQTRVETFTDLQEQFVAFLAELKRANALEMLIIVIDALDEIVDSGQAAATITSFLPAPEQLPDGCFVILTSRPTLYPGILGDIERLRLGSTSFHLINVSPTNPGNQQLLRSYLEQRLPPVFRDPEHVREILARCGGVFLYAFHLSRALDAGVFQEVTALPEGHEFYPAYLARLRDRVGAGLFGAAHLVADQEPAEHPFNASRVPRLFLKYFMPYALAALQRHSLHRTVDEANDIVMHPGQDTDQRLAGLRESLLRFVVQGHFTQVSHREALHRYYRLCQEGMDVPQALDAARRAVSDLDAKRDAERQLEIATNMADNVAATRRLQEELGANVAATKELQQSMDENIGVVARVQRAVAVVEVFIVAVYAAHLWHMLSTLPADKAIHVPHRFWTAEFWQQVWNGAFWRQLLLLLAELHYGVLFWAVVFGLGLLVWHRWQHTKHEKSVRQHRQGRAHQRTEDGLA